MLEDISSVIPRRKLKSNMWKGFTPIYVDGKRVAADCNYCHKRYSKNGGHLIRHFLACPKRPGRGRSRQKGNRSGQPNLKSRAQNKSSPAMTVPITKCKILRTKSSSGITSRPVQVVADHQSPPASDGTSLKKQKTSRVTTAADIGARQFGQDSSYQDIVKLITLHGYPLSVVENEEIRRILKNIKPMPYTVSVSDMEEHLRLYFRRKR
jgi:hypothetical protein